MKKTKNSPYRRRIELRQTQKPVLRYVAAGSLIAVFIAAVFFIYLNIGSNTNALAGISYTWTGTSNGNWSNSSNWSPSGVPGTGDNVTIAAGSNNVLLTTNTTIANITVNSGATINLSGYNLTSTGTSTFNGGTISNSGGACTLITQGSTTTFGNSSGGPTIAPVVSVNSNTVTIMNTTFNGATSITKTGTSNDVSSGNNTYNGSISFTNNGTGYLLMSNATRDIFNTDVTFTSTGTGMIYPAYNGNNTQFNQNIIVNSTSTGGVKIGANNGTSTLAATKTINIGGSGFSGGVLLLGGLTSSTNQSFAFTGSGVLTLGPSSTFGGNITAVCPGICLSGATFNGSASLTKTGASNDVGSGNNTFNGATSIANSGSGYLLMSNSTRDVFNTDVTFTSTGTGIIYPAYNGTNTQFNQNVIVNSTNTGGVRIGANTGTSTLAATKTISVGSSGFSSGMLTLGGLTSSSSHTFSFNGTLTLGPNSAFSGDVTATCGGIYLSGATFNGAANLTKTGTTNDAGSGNNTFNGVTSISNSGTGYLMTANSTRDIFNTDVTFTNTGTGIIYVAYNGANTQFNQNIIVSSNNSGGVRIGASNGTSTLAAGKTIVIGSSGFSGGTLMLAGLTSATNQSITLTGNAVLNLGPNSTFSGDMIANCGGICLNGATFGGMASFTKNGTTSDAGSGNNTFNGITTFTNNGTGYLMTANSTRDIFNTDVTFTSTSSGIIYAAYNGTGTQFNQNIVVNSTGTGGVRLGSSNGTSTLAATKIITVGSSGFSGGTLMLGDFTTSTSQSFLMTGSAVLQLGPSSTFGGDVVAVSGGIVLSGATISGIASFTKTGATNDAGAGNNTFNGLTTIINAGSGYLMTANTTRDIFNSEVIFTSTGSGLIYVAHNGNNTQFNQNVFVNSIGTGGIRFGNSGGTSTLATGKLISVGSVGFSAGGLTLANFATSVDQSFLLTGSGTLTIGPSSTFDGSFTAVCGSILLSGATFNGTASFTKTGSANDQGAGNNTFNGTTSFTNIGTGYLMLSNTTRDVFNSDVTFTNAGTGIMYVGYSDAAGTQFNNNIILNSTGTGSIRFGQNTGKATLADGKTISIGGLGYALGDLYLKGFTQTGTTAQSLSIPVGTSALYLQSGTTFNGAVNFNTPQVYLNGTTFNGVTSIQKNGLTNNTSTGGNIFNAATTIKNSGLGIMYLANSTADDYNSNVTFIQTGLGALHPSYNTASTFAGDISTTGSTAVITFGNAAGTVTLDGALPQNINGSSSFAPTFKRLALNNGTNGVTLNVPLTISSALTLTNGNITSSATNLLIMNSAITVTGVSDASYVNGPMRKIGNQAFTFPVGKNGHYSPISISAPLLATDHFTAEYMNANPNDLYPVSSHDVALHHLSTSEYWTLNRTAGIANVSVTLSWNTQSGGVSNVSDLRVGRWDVATAKWKDLGIGTTTGNTTNGTISGALPSAPFGTFTLGSSSAGNALPIELVSFDVDLKNDGALVKWITGSEENNDYFTIERSADRHSFEIIGTVKGAGNSTIQQSYNLIDPKPFPGTSYYRLKQTDYNGHYEYFNPVLLHNDKSSGDIKINTTGPNPFTDNFKIDFNSGSSSEVTIRLINSGGASVYEEKTTPSEGGNTFEVNNVGNLPQGIYFLQLTQDDHSTPPMKMIKK